MVVAVSYYYNLVVRKAGTGRTSYYVGEKTDGGISLQYLNGAEGESQPALVMFLDHTRRMDLIMWTQLDTYIHIL